MKKEILEKVKKLNKKSKFLLTITMFDKRKTGKELETFVFTNNFPREELDGTKKFIGELIEEQKNK